MVVPTEDQEGALQAQQVAVKAMCQEVQDGPSLRQDWRDSGVMQAPPGSPQDIPQEKVELNNRSEQ